MSTSILAGSLKGRRLKTSDSLNIRPTSSRVRASIFNIIGDLSGKKFLDLYSGAGTLGFEALSRGALVVVFVDNSVEAIKVMQLNAQLFPGKVYEIVKQDVMDYLSQCEKFDIIVADPPYHFIDLNNLFQLADKRLNQGGTLIIESTKRNKWKPEGARIKTYGETQLSIFRK
ncbi:MAG: 16S rRNA (guanine(966)-N(2))-methyltransferase RsmD [Fidelibacterota bacterium]